MMKCNYENRRLYDVDKKQKHPDDTGWRLFDIYWYTACFADKTDLDLMAFAEKEENLGIFEGRNVHFGSCSTLKMREEDIKIFKQLTKARMITGYTKDVDLTSSFIFETWLMDAINRNEGYAAKRINDLAEKEMPYFTKLFGFKAF